MELAQARELTECQVAGTVARMAHHADDKVFKDFSETLISKD